MEEASMRTPLALLTAAASIAGLGAVAATTQGASIVNVGDNYFVRAAGVPTVRAKKGARVTFRFIGRRPHTVSVKSGPSRFSSPTRSSGSYRTPALRKGTYVLYCKIHGQSDQSMKLSVK
jgi:plastocyanin